MGMGSLAGLPTSRPGLGPPWHHQHMPTIRKLNQDSQSLVDIVGADPTRLPAARLRTSGLWQWRRMWPSFLGPEGPAQGFSGTLAGHFFCAGCAEGPEVTGF